MTTEEQIPEESGKKHDSPVGYKRPPVEHQFKPGNPGGPGRPKGTSITALLRAMLEESEGRSAKEVARKILDMAKDGDHKFVETLLNRTEGKVADKLEVSEAPSRTLEWTDDKNDRTDYDAPPPPGPDGGTPPPGEV